MIAEVISFAEWRQQRAAEQAAARDAANTIAGGDGLRDDQVQLVDDHLGAEYRSLMRMYYGPEWPFVT